MKKIRKDKEHGSFLEIITFCEIFKMKIIVYTRNNINEIKKNEENKSINNYNEENDFSSEIKIDKIYNVKNLKKILYR